MSYVGKEARLDEERARLEQQEKDRRLAAPHRGTDRRDDDGFVARLLGRLRTRLGR